MKQMRKEQTLTLLLHGIHTRLSYQKLPKSNRQNKRVTIQGTKGKTKKQYWRRNAKMLKSEQS